MSSKNTSPLLSVRPRSVLASRPLLFRGEGFDSNAWSATEYDPDTDRSCWSPLSGFMPRSRHHSLRSCATNRWLKCQPSSYVRLRPVAIVIVIAFCASVGAARSNSTSEAIDAYLRPYAQSGNFAGDVLVAKTGKVIFRKAYGFADREHRIHNPAATRFHIASVSMQFHSGRRFSR